MEFADLVPIIVILFMVLLIGVAIVVGTVTMIRKGSPKHKVKHETNLDVKRKLETLEKEIENSNSK